MRTAPRVRRPVAITLCVLLPAVAGCGDGTSSSLDAGARSDATPSADASPSVDGATPAADASPRLDGATPSADASPSADGGAVVDCPPPPSCDAPLPALGATAPWRHAIQSAITAGAGAPRHRGRDLFLRASDPQWALAKLAYGVSDDDLQDEDVDLYLLRGCAGEWETLGTATSTDDGEHATVEGVEDTGGRVYFEIPAASRLGLGRHRIAFVVRGDHSMADQYVEVLEPDARIVVTDVDGTQTESETAEWAALLGGSGPAAQPHGAELLWAFSRRGYHVFYLTARPDWLDARTHQWLAAEGYPPGIVHTTLGSTGATGAAAETFKTDELAALQARLPAVEYAIGNTETDAAAYANAGLPPERAYSYRFDPGAIGTRVDDYATLLPVVDALEALCR